MKTPTLGGRESTKYSPSKRSRAGNSSDQKVSLPSLARNRGSEPRSPTKQRGSVIFTSSPNSKLLKQLNIKLDTDEEEKKKEEERKKLSSTEGLTQ